MMKVTSLLFLWMNVLCLPASEAQECHTSPTIILGGDVVDQGESLRFYVQGADRDAFHYVYFSLRDGRFVRESARPEFRHGVRTVDTERVGAGATARRISARDGCCDGDVEIMEGGTVIHKEYFPDAHGVFVSYDFPHRQGIVFVLSPMNKSTHNVYLIRPGAKAEKITKTRSTSAFRYFVFSPDGRYAVSPAGALVNMQEGKVVTEKFAPGIGNTIATAVFNETTSATVRFSADGRSVAVPSGQTAMEVRAVPEGTLLRTVRLPQGLSASLGNKTIPTALLDGFVYFTEPRFGGDVLGAGENRDAWLVQEGSAKKLCYANAEAVAAVLAAQPRRASVADEQGATGAAQAYRELLEFIAQTDIQFEPYARKILQAGKDSWALYGARAKAHDILNRQENAIRDYLRKYRAASSAGVVDALEVRLDQISGSRAKIPAN